MQGICMCMHMCGLCVHICDLHVHICVYVWIKVVPSTSYTFFYVLDTVVIIYY